MEVDSWVSVQARRERFEQLYEDSPLASHQNTPLHPTPRPRTLSTPNKNLQNNDELRASQRKDSQISNHEWDQRVSKYASSSESYLRNSELPTSENFPSNNSEGKKHDDLPCQKDEEHLVNTVTPTFRMTKRIPVFKPTSPSTNRKNVAEEGAKMPISDSQGKRGRIFSHMRSRSHGNFVMKRDSSTEKNIRVSQQNSVTPQKENKCHKDWLTPKCKQRSIDNLLTNEDSKSNSSFAGKQKLVSNVVKNMKNKETPTVLRKFSFSSKNEKETKNIKEKSFIPNKKQPGISAILSNKSLSPSSFSSTQQANSRKSGMNMDHEPITEEKTTKNKSHTSDIAIVPVLLAKAVAEAASKRCAVQTKGKTSSPSSLSSEDTLSDPPARPPRRRAAGPGPVPRRKGKAPSPPSQSSLAAIKQDQRIHNDSLLKNSSQDESSDFNLHRLEDSSEHLKSCESISSCHSAERSFENLNEIIHITSTPVSRAFRIANSQPACKSPNEQKHKDNSKNEMFKTENQSIISKDAKSNTVVDSHHDKNTTLEQNSTQEVEGLPPGPPPKKPPRTFAYDIYRNISMPTLEVEDDDSNKKEKIENNSVPIYAVPLKKKNKIVHKPPVRSKSDLSREIMKPSVAPKPPHILAKAKRASLVDPLSNSEKDDEEAAITSEFQRQAHIRYSLRKPNRIPPSPSCCDTERNIQKNSHLEPMCHALNTQHDPDYSTVDNDNDSNISNYNYRQKRNTRSLTNGSPRSLEIKSQSSKLHSQSKDNYESEYEDVTHVSPSNSPNETEQPLSLSHCFDSTPLPDVTYVHTKRSMSDETLYKGCRREEPVYATPTFKNNNHHRDQIYQKELHYMDEADAGRDGADCRTRRNSIQGREKVSSTETEDGSKGRSSLISAWKREFRQSCRQVQSKIKKTVIR